MFKVIVSAAENLKRWPTSGGSNPLTFLVRICVARCHGSVCVCVCKGRSCLSGWVQDQPPDGEVIRRGFLRSPNWPGEYPADVDCEWTVCAERGRHILVVVSRIELAAGNISADTDEHHCSTTNNSTAGDWLLITDTAGDCHNHVFTVDDLLTYLLTNLLT